MKANASKHKAMSYERMEKEDARLTQEIEAFLTQAEATDAEEDKLYGVGQQQHDLPAELRRREDRRAKIREVRDALKKETAKRRATELQAMADELRAKAEDPATPPAQQAGFATMAAQHDQQAAELDDDDPPPPAVDSDLPRNAPPATPDGTPQPKAQRNLTDPESRIMIRDGGFVQAYNAQIAVDEATQIIVAAALSNQAPYVEYFEPMLRRVVENCDAVPTSITADSGYFSRTTSPLRRIWALNPSSPWAATSAMGYPTKASCDLMIRPRHDARCASSSARPEDAPRTLDAKPPSSPSSGRFGLAAAFARCRFAASSRTVASGC